MKFGYARVSSFEQNLDRQIESLKEYGVEEDNIFTDKISGVRESRPGLDDLLSRLREGDILVVSSFDRLARSTKQLLDLLDLLNEKEVDLISIKESINTSSPQGKLFFTIAAAFSEFERNVIKQRQAEGIAIAKAKRGHCGGRPRLDETKLDMAIDLYMSGDKPVSAISKVTGVSSSSLYRELQKRNLERTKK